MTSPAGENTDSCGDATAEPVNHLVREEVRLSLEAQTWYESHKYSQYLAKEKVNENVI